MSTEVRSVRRALLLLRLMNERPAWSLQALAESSGLAKTSLHRLLATLVVEGYVHNDVRTPGQYCLTPQVRNLSSGVTLKSELVEAAAPVMIAATREMKWPLSLGVIDGDRIKVVFCTMPYSPYAIRPSSEGRRYDIAQSALGRAYLAFCSREERRILVESTNAQGGINGRPLDAASLRSLVLKTRRQGYAIRQARDRSESTAIAVPVFSDGELRGSMVNSTFAGMMSPRRLAQLLPIVQEAARQVGAAVGAGAPGSSR